MKALTLAMFRGFFRDRMTLFWAVLFPLMFLVLFGGILTTPGAARIQVAQVGDVAVLDGLPADVREQIDDALEFVPLAEDEARDQVRDGDLAAAVSQDGDEVKVLFSAADQTRSAQVLGTLGGLVDTTNLALSGVEPRFSLAAEQVEDESLKAIQYVTPGLLGWAVAMSAAFGASLNLVAWRKSGLLRRLRLTPIPTSSVVLARVGVSMVVAFVQAAIFVGLAVGAFGLQLSGWWPLIIPLLAAGTLSFLAIGMLVGAVSKTEEGASGLANFVILPMAFLSGSFFPLDGAPRWLDAISRALPLRHLNEGMLDVMVRGAGPEAIVVPILVLSAFTAVLAFVAMRLFRWDA